MNKFAARRPTGLLCRHARTLMRRMLLAVNGSYRPERHYMRGPGPKCHAKRERASARGEDLN